MIAPVEGCPEGERRRIETAEAAIIATAFDLRYVEYCEDARTPGLLGHIAGVTDWELHLVKIKTRGRTPGELADTLEHERHHVEDPDWDCGNRDVLGRG